MNIKQSVKQVMVTLTKTNNRVTMQFPAKTSMLFWAATLFFSSLSVNAKTSDVYVQLFEWRWTDIAKECKAFIGPKGYSAVVVSPPQEHLDQPQWWAAYQPVSYEINSRHGSREEFQLMVESCHEAGVKILVDAVINHMANGDGSVGNGTAGNTFDRENLNFVDYQFDDFHQPQCGIDDWKNQQQLQSCNLLGLPDLNTAQTNVQDKIALYLNDLRDLGVDGFRIDAAKHIDIEDLTTILNNVSGTPTIFSEVLDPADGAEVRADHYTDEGTVTEVAYGNKLSEVLRSGKIAELKNFGPESGMIDSDDALVFIDNHDTQRWENTAVLTHKEGMLYYLANTFMLAWDYGTPKVMSSYYFDNTEMGMPEQSVHIGDGDRCYQLYACEHRWQSIASMVKFRSTVGEAPVQNWWDNGTDQIAFSRGQLGFAAMNRSNDVMNVELNTGLPEGRYCNIIEAQYLVSTCDGPVIEVDNAGFANIQLEANRFMAIHINAMLVDSAWVTDLTGHYQIISKHSNKAIDVAAGSFEDGGEVHQWDDLDGNNQVWRFEHRGDGYYKIRAVHSGRVLDVAGGGTNNGDGIHQWADVPVDSQVWRIAPTDEEAYVNIINKVSGKSLDVRGISKDNGAKLHQWDFVNGDNQKWRLEKATIAIKAEINNRYISVNEINQNTMATNKDTVGANERFEVISLGGNNVALKVASSGLYVTVSADTSLNATAGEVGSNEIFEWVHLSSHQFALRHTASGLFVSTRDEGNGALMANQTWVLSLEIFHVEH